MTAWPKSIIRLAAVGLLFLTAGCISQTRYTVAVKDRYGVWPENVEYEKLGTTTGKDSNFNLLFFWGVTPPPSYEFAALQAINARKGDGLINVRVEKVEQYWFVGSVEIYEVYGQAIRFKNTGKTDQKN